MRRNEGDMAVLNPPGSRRFSSSKLALVEKVLRRVSVGWADSQQEDNFLGPLGLNLLYEPAQSPRVDFVFVHGIGGGSRKTWSYSEDPALYWPKEWLPLEPGFEHVRIHSFGYKSQRDGKGIPLNNIHDFGQKLVAALDKSPELRRDGDTSIVFVAHSMGGLVVKKAYLMAKRDPHYAQLLNRIKCIFFLATPHRGADAAKLLKRLLQIPGTTGSKAFVTDLTPNSGTLQEINDAFRHQYSDIRLWSFYETVQMGIGPFKQYIVDRDSAVIGLPQERYEPIDADHRSICKFRSRDDPNYKTIYQSFLLEIEQIKTEKPGRARQHRSQLKVLSEYLSVQLEELESTISAVVDKQAPGSCDWLMKKSSVCLWLGNHKIATHARDPSDLILPKSVPQCLWLSGKPGVGKSTAAAHLVRYFSGLGTPCSSYFFRSGDMTKSTISALLRSLAYQLAMVDQNIRELLLEAAQDGEVFDKYDHVSVWRNIFLTRILRLEHKQLHYWVIDALDECTSFGPLFPLLRQLCSAMPLRLFITSRSMPSIARHFSQHNIPVLAEEVTVEDALMGIEVVLRNNSQLAHIDDKFIRNGIIAQIARQSNGSFLWVSLVLNALEQAHSWRAIRDILDGIPGEMNALYGQILQGVATTPHNARIARSILRWVICSARPLTISELEEALYWDIEDVMPSLRSTITTLCGHLVYIDVESRIHTLHETVRAFLTQECPIPQFAMDFEKEHARMAEVCLNYLSGKQLETPRDKPWEVSSFSRTFPCFAGYVCQYFSFHLANATAETTAPLSSLYKFLSTSNALTWIEIIARSGDLSPILQAAKDIAYYLRRKTKYLPSLGQQVWYTGDWVNDLIHLSALFTRNLLENPPSIHFLIPPICPPQSQIFKNFGICRNGLALKGTVDEDWDDRLTSCLHPGEYVISAAYHDTYFAIGLDEGSIVLYRSATFELERKFDHEEPFSKLAFANSSAVLVSASPRKLILWDVRTSTSLWEVEKRSLRDPMEVRFNEDDTKILLAEENDIAVFRVSDGNQLEDIPCYSEKDDDEVTHGDSNLDAYFSPTLDFLALVYRSRPLIIWNLGMGCIESRLERESSEDMIEAPEINSVAFHPNVELGLVAVAYNDEDLILFNIWDDTQQGELNMQVDTIAASPDGQTLAAGDFEGTIYLFDFETLTLLHRITTGESRVRELIFASNSLRFLDVRSDHCNIWQPSALVRRGKADDFSYGVNGGDATSPVSTHEAESWHKEQSITALVAHHGGNYVFCGRANGSILVCDSRTGKIVHDDLYRHWKRTAVHLLDWNAARGVLTSADENHRFISRQVWRSPDGLWHTEEAILDKVGLTTPRQILTSPDGNRLLVSSATGDTVWDLEDTTVKFHHPIQDEKRQWLNHPSNAQHLLLITKGRADVFNWVNFERVTPDTGIPLESRNKDPFAALQVVPSRQGQNICLNYLADYWDHRLGLSKTEVWDASEIQPSTTAGVPSLAYYDSFPAPIKAIIGSYKSLLLFIDSSSWVCSINIGGPQQETQFTKHFFIPFTWYSGSQPLMAVTSKGNVVFGAKGRLVVFHGGFKFEKTVQFRM